MRPKTLAEVAQMTLGGDSFDRCLANFLDEFYGAPNAAALLPEPPRLSPYLDRLGLVQDAYLAATAEYLASVYGFAVPIWVAAESRKLHSPWFASSLEALRAALILESPAAFRSRNLFVSENALTRV
jgi:hypothetical protein